MASTIQECISAECFVGHGDDRQPRLPDVLDTLVNGPQLVRSRMLRGPATQAEFVALMRNAPDFSPAESSRSLMSKECLAGNCPEPATEKEGKISNVEMCRQGIRPFWSNWWRSVCYWSRHPGCLEFRRLEAFTTLQAGCLHHTHSQIPSGTLPNYAGKVN